MRASIPAVDELDVRQKIKTMKHYAVIFHDFIDKSERNAQFVTKIYARYPGSIGEADVGVYFLSSDETAEQILEFLAPAKNELSDVYMVLELGANAAIGCAGSKVVRALSNMMSVSR